MADPFISLIPEEGRVSESQEDRLRLSPFCAESQDSGIKDSSVSDEDFQLASTGIMICSLPSDTTAEVEEEFHTPDEHLRVTSSAEQEGNKELDLNVPYSAASTTIDLDGDIDLVFSEEKTEVRTDVVGGSTDGEMVQMKETNSPPMGDLRVQKSMAYGLGVECIGSSSKEIIQEEFLKLKAAATIYLDGDTDLVRTNVVRDSCDIVTKETNSPPMGDLGVHKSKANGLEVECVGSSSMDVNQEEFLDLKGNLFSACNSASKSPIDTILAQLAPSGTIENDDDRGIPTATEVLESSMFVDGDDHSVMEVMKDVICEDSHSEDAIENDASPFKGSSEKLLNPRTNLNTIPEAEEYLSPVGGISENFILKPQTNEVNTTPEADLLLVGGSSEKLLLNLQSDEVNNTTEMEEDLSPLGGTIDKLLVNPQSNEVINRPEMEEDLSQFGGSSGKLLLNFQSNEINNTTEMGEDSSPSGGFIDKLLVNPQSNEVNDTPEMEEDLSPSGGSSERLLLNPQSNKVNNTTEMEEGLSPSGGIIDKLLVNPQNNEANNTPEMEEDLSQPGGSSEKLILNTQSNEVNNTTEMEENLSPSGGIVDKLLVNPQSNEVSNTTAMEEDLSPSGGIVDKLLVNPQSNKVNNIPEMEEDLLPSGGSSEKLLVNPQSNEVNNTTEMEEDLSPSGGIIDKVLVNPQSNEVNNTPEMEEDLSPSGGSSEKLLLLNPQANGVNKTPEVEKDLSSFGVSSERLLTNEVNNKSEVDEVFTSRNIADSRKLPNWVCGVTGDSTRRVGSDGSLAQAEDEEGAVESKGGSLCPDAEKIRVFEAPGTGDLKGPSHASAVENSSSRVSEDGDSLRSKALLTLLDAMECTLPKDVQEWLKTADILEVAQRKGLEFPRPRWWRPGGYGP